MNSSEPTGAGETIKPFETSKYSDNSEPGQTIKPSETSKHCEINEPSKPCTDTTEKYQQTKEILWKFFAKLVDFKNLSCNIEFVEIRNVDFPTLA